MAGHSASEAGTSARHRRIPAEQGGDVMRILSGVPAMRLVCKLECRSSNFAELEPRVRTIVENIRQKGEVALRAYSRKWDGLGADGKIQVPVAQLEAAWAMSSPQLREALRTSASNIRRFCEPQRPGEWTRNGNGIAAGQRKRPPEA